MRRPLCPLTCGLIVAAASSVARGEQHEIYRNRATFQIGPSTLTPLVFQGGINVFRDDPNTVSSVIASNAGALFEAELNQDSSRPTLFEYRTADLASIEDLESQIPYGDYQLRLTPADGGDDLFAALSDPQPRFTNIPLFTNYDSFDAFDPSLPFTVEWDAMTGGNSLALQIFGSGGFYYVQQLDAGAVGGTVPAHTLEPNTQYFFSLVFANVALVDPAGFGGSSVGQVFYQHFTQAAFITVPEPSAAALLAVVGLAVARRRR